MSLARVRIAWRKQRLAGAYLELLDLQREADLVLHIVQLKVIRAECQARVELLSGID